jgi:SAM-dependent methyltransferase
MAREVTGVSASDTVLDVACGPGLLAFALASAARRVTGLDLTPAMLLKARQLQAERGLDNLGWVGGSADLLPFGDGMFSLVVSRYTFHHLIDPRRALAEMVRVCRPGGKVALIDIAIAPDKADAFNRMETLRDPSHVRAMTADELTALMVGAGLTEFRSGRYGSEVELEKQLRASFPTEPNGYERLRQLFMDDLTTGALGMGTQRRDGAVYIAYPILILVGTKP